MPTRSTTFLSEDPEMFFQTAVYLNGDTAEGKWMTALLSPIERQILREAKEKTDVYLFDQIANVAVGIVTGANKFFLVPDDVVTKFGLNNWAYPMFGRSEHVPGVIFDEAVLQDNKDAGLPTNFLWFKDEPIHDLPPTVQEYLFSGETEGLHKRYKCRIRIPWYSVPSVYSTNLGMLKRSHDFPRLILNKIRAFTTDTAYRIQSKHFSPPSLVYSFVNSLTALTAEVEGRHYGGGVLELVPSEIRKLLLPAYEVPEEEVWKLDAMFRSGMRAEYILACQDSVILKNTGFTDQECAYLHNAWLKLRARRQRIERIDERSSESDG